MARDDKYKESDAETLRLIKEIPIQDYAARIGFTPVKIGRYYTLEEHDSVRIDTQKNCFWRNSNKHAGSIIDFALEFNSFGGSEEERKKEVILELKALCGVAEPAKTATRLTSKPEPKEDKPFLLPEKGQHAKNIYAYLIQTRGIDKEIVCQFIRDKQLYQDIHRNCIFVSYSNGVADFACYRGTTSKRFLGDVTGSNYDRCFVRESRGATTLIVTESVIEAMSIMTLQRRAGRNLSEFSYQALSSVEKYPAVAKYIQQHPEIEKIIIATNNDDGGRMALDCIKKDLEDIGWAGKAEEALPKNQNDWNDVLVAKKGLKSQKKEYAKGETEL